MRVIEQPDLEPAVAPQISPGRMAIVLLTGKCSGTAPHCGVTAIGHKNL